MPKEGKSPQKKIEKKKKRLPISEYKKEDWIYLRKRKERKDRPNINLDHQ